MALTMKQRYGMLDLSKLPNNLSSEFKKIKEDTENFSDPDLVEVFNENFDLAWGIVQKNHPEAIKGKIAKKKETPKPVIKAKPKVKITKKTVSKPKPKVKVKEKPKTKPKDKMRKLKHKFSFTNYDIINEMMNNKNLITSNFVSIPIYWEYKNDPFGGSPKKDSSGERIPDEWIIEGNFTEQELINIGKIVERKEKIKQPTKSIKNISECKKVLREAGYTTKKSLVDKKKVIKRVKRQDNTIIKEDVSKAITTIAKDTVKSKETRVKYSDSLRTLNSIKKILTGILQSIDKLYNDNDNNSLKKIEKVLKEIS